MKFTSALVAAFLVACVTITPLRAHAQNGDQANPASTATQRAKTANKSRSNIQNNRMAPAPVGPATASSVAHPKSINKLKTKSNQANE